MENKFKPQQQQKTTTNSSSNNNNNNNNNKTAKYLDHVYCHTNAHDNKSYMRANNNHHNNNNNNAASAGGGQDGPALDMYALMKENKQLKAMLILHLDLIQEQSDQLLYKDKKLSTQSERIEALGQAKQQLEAQVQELQYQLQRQLKRANVVAPKELTSVSPPPLAKIQSNVEANATQVAAQQAAHGGASKHIIGECNGKLISKIKLQRVELAGVEEEEEGYSANSSCTSSDDGELAEQRELDKSDDTKGKPDDEDVEHSDDVAEDDEDDNDDDDDDEGDEVVATSDTTAAHQSDDTTKATATESLANALKPTLAAPAVQQICVTPPTPSRGKQMPLMLWHAPNMHSDESGSGESMADTEQQHCENADETPTAAGEPNKAPSTLETETRSSQSQPLRRSRRLAYLTTTKLYYTREWEDNAATSDGEQIKEEFQCAAAADGAQLEIPKWIEHELSPLYCIEGTEDLCDDTFLKRHAKLEVDEKRRKKWDVQQIREQRRIEKLKRRHCKEELQTAQDQQTTPSFYPPPEEITTIYYTSQLPVQAFGEMIPKLSTTSEFTLPWLREPDGQAAQQQPPQQTQQQAPSASTSGECATQSRVPVQNSSFNFLKKRRRRQSSTTTNMPTARQRTLAAAKAAEK